MQNTGLDEAQAGIKIARRNINNLRYAAEKAMATHSSILAWKIPWTEELGAGYCPWGHKESGTTE